MVRRAGKPGSPGRSGKVEPKKQLVVEHAVAGLDEPVPLVEGKGTAVAFTAARPHDGEPRAVAEVLDDQVERRGAVAPALVPLVDEEPPEVLRDVVVVVDLVADHHEADG